MIIPAGQLSHFPRAPRVVNERPAYVMREFAGACKIFPAPYASGPGAGQCPFMLGYQDDWITDDSRLKIEEKARQIGITWGTAYRHVRLASRERALWDSWISSRDEIQAGLFIDDCRGFANIFKLACDDLGIRIVDAEKNTARTLRLVRDINSLSSNPNAQAGKRGHRLLDEFALHADPRLLYNIAYPGITWGGSLEIVSTHRGSANFFNELLREARERGNPKGWSIHRVTLQTALEHGFLYKLQCKLPADDERQGMDEAAYFDFIKAGAADEESFAQEYMCVPGDDAAAFISYDLVSGCTYKAVDEKEWRIVRIKRDTTQSTHAGFPVAEPHDVAGIAFAGPCHVGMDVARTGDLTVIELSEKVGGVEFVRLVVEMHDTTFATQEAWLYAMIAHPAVRRACIDQTGIGRQLVERAIAKFGAHRVEGVNFTTATKEEMAYPVKADFEDRAVRIPPDARYTADLRAIRKTSVGGNDRFAADHGKNGHADRFWARALCHLAGKTAVADPHIGII